MALQVFTSARAGLEATRGTSVTPTRLLYAEEWTHEQDIKVIRSPLLRNSYNPVYSVSRGTETNQITSGGRGSYEDLVWLFNTHVKAVAAGTGAGADKTWLFSPTSASDDIKSATVQLGYADTIATAPGIQLPYCVGNELSLTFSKDDDGAIRYSSTLVSPSVATNITAFTGSLSDRTLNFLSANTSSVTIDPTTIGTTADANIISVEWTVSNGFVNLYTLNNSAAASGTYRPAHRTWTATITRHFVNDTEWLAYKNATLRKVRVVTTGPALGASQYTLILDMYGHYTARSMSDVDGIKTEVLTLEQTYDTAAAADFTLQVITAEATIT